jgi:hypothetical protein
MGLIFFTIVISVIGLIIFSNGEDNSKNEVVSKKSDDEDFYKDDEASYSFLSDDDSSSIHFINPASGAPMIGDGTDGVDTMGNVFGTDDMFSSDDTFHHTDV